MFRIHPLCWGMKARLAVIIGLSAVAVSSVRSQRPAAITFTRTDVMVPMRDGTTLFTVVMRPTGVPGQLPFLMQRTPYGAEPRATALGKEPTGISRDLATEGYIFIFQDIRGRYRSGGEFLMTRPPGSARVDESTDTWDTIDWLLTNVPGHNGRVGIRGISYSGWLVDQSLVNPHPALKAASPQATAGDMWMGDDFFHQGAWRQTYGTEYAWMMEASKDESVLPTPGRFDTYDWYLSFPTLGSLAQAIGARRWPTWRAFVEHPVYDSFWQGRAVPRYLTRTSVPTLTVGGIWDQEDLYGPQATYRAREAADAMHLNYLVLGPWSHGQWAAGDGESLGNIHFGSRTGDYYRRQIEEPWFAFWLKDKGHIDFPEALVFDAGARVWRRYDAWPPKDVVETRLYFGRNSTLSFDKPKETNGQDTFVSDPMHPVPYRPRPVEWTYADGSRWEPWMTEDQRFVEGRPDVLMWQTAPLERDVTIAGNVGARIFGSTTGSDADWVVKLIDVYPDSAETPRQMRGYQLMVAGDIMRGRYRQGFERAMPVPPNTTVEFHVDLHQLAYTFEKGHRIMVHVQSTWFPLYDRNPQTFAANIFQANASDYRAQTHRVSRTESHPSSVEIMVVR
jgi:putative CocE/NonD family hydrolase